MFVYTSRSMCGVILMAALASGPAAAKMESYKLDPAHTQVVFSIDRFGFTRIMGEFTNLEGTVRLDRDAPAKSSVEAVIVTDSLESGDAKRDAAVKSKFWLNVAANPEIRFKSTAVEVTGEHSAKVAGLLTLMKVTKPVTLDVTLNKIGRDPATQKQAAGFSASTRILRSDFGMNTAQELIGDEVFIKIEALGHLTAE